MKYIALILIFLSIQSFSLENLEKKSFDTIPTNFIKQPLTAIKGSILIPKDWFYQEIPQRNGYTWILSKENSKTSDYVTGMRIQLLQGIKKGTNKTAEEFANDFLNSKKNSFKIIHNYPTTKQNPFTRKGIEVEEEILINNKLEVYHITYSMFWNNKIDMLLVVTHGTTKKLWTKYIDTFSIMAKFKLLENL
jgi:hypothetical protein